MTTFSQTVTLDFGNLGEGEGRVDYTYSPSRPGYYDEPAEVKILNVWLYELDVLQYLPDQSYDSLLDTISNNHSYED